MSHLVGGERIGTVEVAEDFYGVLVCAKVGKHPVEMFLNVQCLYRHLVAVEGHKTRFHAESTRLVESSATRLCAQLAEIGDIHFAKSVEI